jgi:hypothetical protein
MERIVQIVVLENVIKECEAKHVSAKEIQKWIG